MAHLCSQLVDGQGVGMHCVVNIHSIQQLGAAVDHAQLAMTSSQQQARQQVGVSRAPAQQEVSAADCCGSRRWSMLNGDGTVYASKVMQLQCTAGGTLL